MFGRRKRQITRLLLVEDEPLVAFDNEHALSDAGFEIVATVDRAAAAIAALGDGEGIDLVVADVRLADGSGVDVARAAQAAGVPVLFVTGQRPSGAEGLAEGWLAKPYGPRDLAAAIRAVEGRMAGKEPGKLPKGLQLFERIQA
jgi:DNA-binding response OmpR family regulator